MKKYYQLIIILGVAALYACNKQSLDTPNFDATVNKTTFKVGDSVVFKFTGQANFIQFWSGETKHAYANRARLSSTDGVNTFSFTTATANLAAGETGQTNNLKVMVSTNFNGFVDSASIRNASWTDITNRATLATNATTTNSGTINVSDFQTTKDSLFVAFKYQSTTNSATSRARQYTIGSFVFNNTFPDGQVYANNTLVTDTRQASFVAFSYKGASTKDSIKWVTTGTTLTIAQGVNNLSDEDWVIAKGISLKALIPDVAVGIQNSNVNALTQYVYKYTAPGTYVVTFVATNNYVGDVKTVVKQFTITVTP